MGQARRNPMSAQGKKGAARDAARLRQYLAGCVSEGELRAFVDAIATPEQREEVLRVCWPLAACTANTPYPGPLPETAN